MRLGRLLAPQPNRLSPHHSSTASWSTAGSTIPPTPTAVTPRGQVSAIPLGHLGVPETSPKSQRLRHSFLGPRWLQNTLSGTPAPTLLEPPLRDTQTLCP